MALNRLALIRHTATVFAGILLSFCVAGVEAAHAQATTDEAAASKAASESAAADTSEIEAQAGDGTTLDEGLVADEATAYTARESVYLNDDEDEETAEPSQFPPPSHYDVGFSYQFETDVDGGGNFHMWEAFVEGVYDVDMTDRFAVVTQFDYRADVYEFDDAPPDGTNGFPLLQWGIIHTPRLEPLAAFRLGDDWRLYAGPVFDFSFEGGANIREAFRPGGLVAAEWTIGPDLRAGLGLIVVADLDSKAYFSPVLLLDWNMTDSLALHMESWTTRGGELELGWQPLEQLEVAAALGYRREYYRLGERTYDANPLPNVEDFQPMQISEALVQDRAYIGALRVSWLPAFGWVKNTFGDLRIDLDADVDFLGSFTIDDPGGSEISKEYYDAAPSLGLSFHVPL